MKKITYLLLIIFLFLANFGYSQFNYSNDFTANATGWTGTITRTTSATCTGAGLRLNIYNTVPTGTAITPLLGVSNGNAVNLSFSYKVANWSANTTGTPNPWGSMKVQYGATATGPWTDVYTIDQTNHVVSGSCATVNFNFTPPTSSNVYVKFDAVWSSGDYYLNIDNFSALQISNSPPNCAISHVPIDLATGVARNVSLSWANGGNATSYDVYFGTTTNPALVGNQSGTTYTPALLAANTDYYWKIVPKNINGDATGCVERMFTTGTSLSYCNSTYANGAGTTDGITNVTLGSLNNTSTQNNVAPYYTFYNSVTIPDIAQATSANVSITFGSDGTQYSAVWIDFNQNGTFEASEGFLSPGNAGASGTSIISVTIPAGAVLGNTRMRVRGGNDSALTTAQACGASSSGFGETEDYIVNITAPPACNVPSVLSVTSVTASSANISWTAAVPAPAVGYQYAVTTSATPPASGTPIVGTTTSVSLSAQTTYYLHVRSECTAGTEFSAWVTSASFTTLCNAITTLPHIEGFDTVGVVPTCWTRSVTGTNNWSPVASNDGVPAPRTGTAFAGKGWTSATNDTALFISPVYNLTANPTSVARVNVWIYRNAANGLATDRTAFYVNTTNNLTGATQLLDIPLRTSEAPVVAASGWYNYIANIPLSYNTGGNFYVIAVGTTTTSFSSYSVGFDDYALEFEPTDTPDYVNLQWPPSATIDAGDFTTVYGQVYEGGLTDATTSQAAGIEMWVGISPIGANTNPNTWTTWIPTTWNAASGVNNNDEYQANIGSTLTPGTYYYATRFQLNGGPFVYGGIDSSNNGNFWDGTTYNSGVLTVNANPTQCAINPNPANNAIDVSTGNVTFTWGAPTSGPAPTSYEVWGGTTSGALTLITTVTSPTVDLTITGYNTVFYWRIVPISLAGGTATGCTEWTFTTQSDPFLPYCSTITYTSAVEPITLVNFAGINNSSTNVVGGAAIENYISIVGNVNAGQTYTMTLKGNSDGNFTNNYRVFIDFNQDGDFADAGETFNAGSITNSTGLDAATAVSNITIPLTANGGNTRMRVKKLFGTTDIDNPCIGGGFGQIEDYTLNITALCATTATWDGTAWTGTPSATAALIFNDDYTHTTATILEGCTCTINGASVVTFDDGTLRIQNNLSTAVGTSLVMESGASFVQVNTVIANSVLGTFTAKRDSSPIVRLDYTAWASPVAGQNALAFSPQTVTNRFYEYDPAANVYSGIDPATTSFTAGKGLLVRAPNNWSSDVLSAYPGIFTGVPNNGNSTPTVGNWPSNPDASSKGFNLLGNPYASPIDANLFLNNVNNSALGMTTLYFWTHKHPYNSLSGSYGTNNYATYNTTGGSPANVGEVTPDGIIQVGQGFLVDATANGSAAFNNTMRLSTSNGQFFKTTGELNQPITIEKHRMWLGLTSPNNNHNVALIGYVQGATNAVDSNFDAKLFDQASSILYSPINNSKYVIQGRSLPFDVTDVVPLGLVAQTAGQYTIVMTNFDGLFTGQDIFLRDNLLNVTHDIKGSSYTFASDAGEFNSRFEIVYASPLAVVTPTFTENSVVVYNNETGITINAGQTTIDNVKVFDVRGRLLVSKSKVNASSITIENVTTEKQVLIVQITSSDNVTISKKVIN